MTTTSTNLVTSAASVPLVKSSPQQVVTCVTGGYRFALPTTHLSGVYQVSRHQLGKDLEVLSTPEGDLPVASLSTLLSLHLGLNINPSEQERALVAIRSGQQVATIRVGQVSRPIDVAPVHWHKIPNVAQPSGKTRLFSHITNVAPDSSRPNESLALVIDPLKALRFENEQADSEPAAAIDVSKSIASSLQSPDPLPTRRGSDHLISFVPEDVPRQNLNFVFCLPLASVAAVVTSHSLLTSPVKSDIFSGYILWRKMPVPIIKLGSAFGMSSREGEQRSSSRGRRLVIARADGHRYIGFYTQTQMHSMKIPASSVTKFAELDGSPHMGAFKTDYGVMVIPDLTRLLDD